VEPIFKKTSTAMKDYKSYEIEVNRSSTNRTIICAKATTTSPITAYRMVFFALVTLPASPPEVMYLIPPTIIITTAIIPTTAENRLSPILIALLMLPLALAPPVHVPSGFSSAPAHKLFCRPVEVGGGTVGTLALTAAGNAIGEAINANNKVLIIILFIFLIIYITFHYSYLFIP
jgi:hypothetical protein